MSERAVVVVLQDDWKKNSRGREKNKKNLKGESTTNTWTN